jgi:stage II sporulation protein D
MVKKYILKKEDVLLLLLPVALVLLLIIKPGKTEVEAPPMVIEREETLDSSVVISVYRPHDDLIVESDLEEYLVGVVAAEMPPDFEIEALKAQAVAARTYALGRVKGYYGSASSHFGADICTDSTHCQAWISKERFLEVYGDEDDWNRIEQAVMDTKNIVVSYAGTLINPLYHSNSGGVTEDVEEVWAVSGSVPYLRSVYSPDESGYPGYERKVLLSWDEIRKKVKNKYPKAEFKGVNDIEIERYDASGRVAEIRIGSVTMKGVEFRELLDLRSTNIGIAFPAEGSVEITTIGYGHGVGMSQCGADALAKEGYGYVDILEYYYTGVEVGEMAQ